MKLDRHENEILRSTYFSVIIIYTYVHHLGSVWLEGFGGEVRGGEG